MDRERLAKLMMMTTSASDGEAVVALRKANTMMQAAGINWQEMLLGKQATMRGPVRPSPPPPRRSPPPPPPPSQRGGNKPKREGVRSNAFDDEPDLRDADMITSVIEHLLETVNTTSGYYAFVERMQGVFERKGRLTKGQFDALRQGLHASGARR